MSAERRGSSRRPSRTVSILVSVALVVAWSVVRLALFDAVIFPLTYVIPLMACVWTRDRLALWIMAGFFGIGHIVKLIWILPPDAMTPAEFWASLTATLANIIVGAIVVHLIIGLRERLERSLAEVRAQADELQAQGEELAQQNEALAEHTEELTRQTEELSQQGEELSSQNEELQSQGEEISVLNEALTRRGQLLETLLDVARLAADEAVPLRHIVLAALDLFGADDSTAAIWEQTSDGLRLHAAATDTGAPNVDDGTVFEDGLVALVLDENRTAGLNDVALRPDLAIPTLPAHPPVRAVLCAPIRFADIPFGAIAVYRPREHDWTEEEFRLAEWLADQASRVMHAWRLQAELRDADQRKNEFLATLSHELRNPLTPMRFALKLLEAREDTDGKAVRVMQRQFLQLVRLVDDLLDATRLSRNKIQVRKEHIDLVPIVHHAIEAAKPDIDAASHTLDVAVPTAPVWVEADPERLGQVITNLLSNATRYTPAGGRISVALAAVDGDAWLTVADTGVGLDRSDLQRVFDMFTQVGGPGSGGLGIGLALVRGIVELHDGHVDVHSDGVGRGSEFRVRLPLMAPLAQVPAVEVQPKSLASARRVLVVDDNVDSATMTGALLELHGHDVRIAHDGEQAMAVARDFAPHVAVLDIGLPGLDGYELAQRFRQDVGSCHIRLIAVTGWGQDADRARARAAGFDAHLTKPAEPDAILAALGTETDVLG